MSEINEHTADKALADLFQEDILGIWNDIVEAGKTNPEGIKVEPERLKVLYEMARRFYNQIMAEDWIEWHGGNCPVGADVEVEVVLGNGEDNSGKAKHFVWMHFDYCLDIVKYRVKR